MRRRIRRREAGAFFESALDGAFLGFLVIFALLWRLLHIFIDASFTCGARQRFWMHGYQWGTSLLEMFGWAFLLLTLAWVGVFLVPRRRPRLGWRITEAALLFFVWLSWGLNWSGYFPYGTVAQITQPVMAVLYRTPLFATAFLAEEETPYFLGADGELHTYDLPPSPPLPEAGHMLGTRLPGNVFYGFGCSCLSVGELDINQAHRRRDAILATGIEPHPEYFARWAELPPLAQEPAWCPLPGDPIGGWPDGHTRP